MKLGFTCGAWDLLHPGHLHFLKESMSQCDKLIVGLHTNPNIDRKNKNAPVQSVFERYYQLSCCNLTWKEANVMKIIPYDTEEDLENMLAILPINIRFLGSDYDESIISFTGKKLCEDRNIKIVYIPRLHNYSSSELRKRLQK